MAHEIYALGFQKIFFIQNTASYVMIAFIHMERYAVNFMHWMRIPMVLYQFQKSAIL